MFLGKVFVTALCFFKQIPNNAEPEQWAKH